MARATTSSTATSTSGTAARRTSATGTARASSTASTTISELSPAENVWTLEKFGRYTEERPDERPVRGRVTSTRAIFQPTYLKDFYINGFNTTERNGALAEKHPDKLITNGAWDPRDEEAGLEALEALHERWNLKGVKLYTAEWKGDSKGYKLTDPWSYRYLEKTEELGIKNIHIHKGPTIYPLNRDAFDVADVDEVATAFPNLNFIIEHVGLPRLEDFCWIATQEPNVYGGLAVAMPFIHSRPRYFAQIIGELLYWIGEDRITFASDYAHLAAEVAHRDVRRLPDPGGHAERVRHAHHGHQEEDPRA